MQLSWCIQTAKNFLVHNGTTDQDSPKKLEEALQAINAWCQKLELPQLEQLSLESLDALAKNLQLKYPKHLVKNRNFGMLCNLVDYRKHGLHRSFRLLWGTLFQRKASPDKIETSVLWRGFRQVTTPTTYSCDVFPFISYYSNEEEQTTVSSFAWRLFRRETSPQGNKLWLFFLPFQ